jgi:hypothetical protein
MSFSEAFTSNFPNPNSWKNVSFNNVDAVSITGTTGGPTITGNPVVIQGPGIGDTDILSVVKTDATPGGFGYLEVFNQNKSGSIKLVSQNGNTGGQLWTTGPMSITSFKPDANISINPNNVGALTASLIGNTGAFSQVSITNLNLSGSLVTSYSPTLLNYYEEAAQIPIQYSGLWAAPQNANMFLTRIGRIVTLYAQGALANSVNAGNTLAITGLLPARFRPNNSSGINFITPLSCLQDNPQILVFLHVPITNSGVNSFGGILPVIVNDGSSLTGPYDWSCSYSV